MSQEIIMVIPTKKEVDISTEKTKEIKLGIDKRSGNSSYRPLTNKPSINKVILIDDKTSEDLGLQDKMEAMSIQEIEKILYLD